MKKMERVVILATSEDTSEIRSLLQTLGISIIGEFVQKRPSPHKVGFLGPGRLQEVEQKIKELDYDAIVVNGVLRPSQHHYLEMRFQKECLDRTGVILRIFADHAHTPEAIAQVTLARLRYELPFLREWIHKAKRGDRPGFLAGGAYATDVYYEHAKTQARRIERSLAELSRRREVTRSKRHAKGYSLVSLAGYTNAGKSALFNFLCQADVEVSDMLFSTLSTTTRKVQGIPGNILMVDTVGFIRDLPPDLVDAFNSTLEEMFFADLILLVFDSSEPTSLVKSKVKTCIDILLPKMHDQSLVVIANKIDLVNPDRLREILTEVRPMIGTCPLLSVSAKTGNGLNSIRSIIGALQKRNLEIDAELPVSDDVMSMLSRIRANCDVKEIYVNNRIKVVIKCKSDEGPRIIGSLRKIRAIKIESHMNSAQEEREIAKETSKGSEGAPLP